MLQSSQNNLFRALSAFVIIYQHTLSAMARTKSNSPAFLHCTSGVGFPLTEQTSSATSPVRELMTTCTKLSVMLIVLVVVVLDLGHVDLRLEQHLHHNLSLYVLSHLQHKILGFASKK